MARLATRAKMTRSTSVVNRRPPTAARSASPTPNWVHRPSSSHAAPNGRDATTSRPSPSPVPASAVPSPR